jgi:SAM-dependent methyltransferase
MKYDQNCIVFDGPIAKLYDETRPFLPPDRPLEVLCVELSRCARDGESTVSVVDLGAGTGRIGIPLALRYANLHRKGQVRPKLSITCVDLSTDMLSELQGKWGLIEQECSGSVQLILKKDDIRLLGRDGPQFDAALAHWIFHIIDDWRVAVYAVDKVLRPKARLFLFTEESDLYRAIDGDLDDIKDPTLSKLWQEVSAHRATVDNESLRRRLGTYVIDDRVETLFGILGWESGEVEITPKWTTKRSIQWVIEKIIEPRSFTNMRFYIDDRKAESAYQEIANRLRTLFSTELSREWTFETSLRIQEFNRKPDAYPTKLAGSILIDVARATIGRRWERSVDRKGSIVSLWNRLIRSTWSRLNGTDGVRPEPVAGTDLKSQGMQYIYLSAPTNVDLSEAERMIGQPELPSALRSHPDLLWKELTSSMEKCEPFVICIGMTSDEADEIRRKWAETSRIHPPLNVLRVGTEAQRLREVVKGWPNNEDFALKLSRVLSEPGREELYCREILRKACSEGIISRDYERTGPPVFLTAIARLLLADGSVSCTYVLPIVPARRDPPVPSLGFLLGASGGIESETTRTIWLLGDILLGAYDDEVVETTKSEEADITEALEPPTPLARDAAPESASELVRAARAGESTSPVLIDRADSKAETEEGDAISLLKRLDLISMKRNVIVGNYVRYNKEALRDLPEAKRRIVLSCKKPSPLPENYLVWGFSGQGKTYFLSEIARAESIKYIEINFKDRKKTEAELRSTLQECWKTTDPYLCVIDEVDTRASEEWPFKLVFEILDWNIEKKKTDPTSGNIVVILVGSTLPNLKAMTDRIESSKEKGPDIIHRIPSGNRLVIPPLTMGDRLVIVLSQLRAIAKEMGKEIVSAEKLALFYILSNADLADAHQLKDIVERSLGRLPESSNRLSYDALFEVENFIKYEFREGEPEAKEKLAGEFLYITD